MGNVHLVIERYRPALARVAASYTWPGPEREDLVQEICLALVKASPRYRGEGSEKAYVLRIAHNVGLTHAHRRKRRSVEVRTEEPLRDDGLTPEERAAKRQGAERLLAAVRSLAPPYRQVVVLSLEGCSYREVGEVLGVSENAVGARLNRAKKMLVRALEEKDS